MEVCLWLSLAVSENARTHRAFATIPWANNLSQLIGKSRGRGKHAFVVEVSVIC